MILFPAIDLYEKKAVRLYKGDYANMTVYSENPIEIARDFENCGCTHIHMVDLEGAKDGTTPNLDTVRDILSVGLPVEVGAARVKAREEALLLFEDVAANKVTPESYLDEEDGAVEEAFPAFSAPPPVRIVNGSVLSPAGMPFPRAI